MSSWSKNNYILSFLIACCWGPSFMFIKVGLTSFPPLVLVECRLIIAAILLFMYLRLIGVSLPHSPKTWFHCAVQGVLAAALPFSLYSIGEQYIDSLLAAIINGLTPIFAVVCAGFFLKTEPLTLDRLLGVMLGFFGFSFLLLPSLLDQNGIRADTLGIAAVSVAAFSYAIAIIYGKRVLPSHIGIAIPACQLITAAIILLPFALIFDFKEFHVSALQLPAVLSLLGLSILGTVIAFIIYFRILEFGGAVVLSMAIYLLPIFGVVFGIVVLHEKMNSSIFLGVIFIVLGMMFANRTLSLKRFSLRLRKSTAD